MPAYKVSYVNQTFIDFRAGGWTENLWFNTNNVATLKFRALAVRDMLNTIKGDSVLLNAIRYAEYDLVDQRFNRSVFFDTFQNVDNPSTTEEADYPTTAICIQLKSKAGGNHDTLGYDYQAKIWIKGIKDSYCTNGGKLNQAGPLGDALNAFIAELEGQAWGLRVLNKNVPQKAITAISNTGIVTCPGHGYANGTRVYIGRVNGLVGANGFHRITNLTADTFQINGFLALPVGAGGYGASMYVKLVQYIFVDITSAKAYWISKRNVGRPFALLTGSRR